MGLVPYLFGHFMFQWKASLYKLEDGFYIRQTNRQKGTVL